MTPDGSSCHHDPAPLPECYFKGRWDELARKGIERQGCAEFTAGPDWQWAAAQVVQKAAFHKIVELCPLTWVCTSVPDLAENL